MIDIQTQMTIQFRQKSNIDASNSIRVGTVQTIWQKNNKFH